MDAFLAGYFSAGNIGDEVYRCALEEFARRAGMRFGFLSHSSEVEVSSESGMIGVHYKDLAGVAAAVRKSRCVIFPGGSVLQNATSRRSLVYYLSLIESARSLRKPVYFLSQGIGPVRGRFSTTWLNSALKKTQGFAARDEQTYEALGRMQVPGVVQAADWAFLMKPANTPEEPPIEGGVLVLKRDVRASAVLWREVIQSVRPTCKSITLFSFHRHDIPLHREIARDLTGVRLIDSVPGPAEALARIGRASWVISERLHPLYFAYSVSIPFIGVGADPKIVAFCAEVGFPCLPPGFTPPQLLAALSRLLSRAGPKFDKIDILRGRAKLNGALLEDAVRAR